MNAVSHFMFGAARTLDGRPNFGIVILVIAGMTGGVVVCASMMEGPRAAAAALTGLMVGFAAQFGVAAMWGAPIYGLIYSLSVSLALAAAYSWRGRSVAATAAFALITMPVALDLSLHENSDVHRLLMMLILPAYPLEPVMVSLLFREAWRIHGGKTL